jgi:hypothetical protein
LAPWVLRCFCAAAGSVDASRPLSHEYAVRVLIWRTSC